ncbi:MAG: ABC transporter ATP-binding protein [Thermodesulfobacteriota bacterium]
MLMTVRNLSVCYPVYRGFFFPKKIGEARAVDEVSFQIEEGATLGLVGESGCGKTTTGRAILLLEKPTGGEIRFEGEDIVRYDRRQLRDLRRRMQIVFQDPMGSLDPRMRVRDIVGEPLRIHEPSQAKGEYREHTDHLLEMVGLHPGMGARYPHEFSGGQRQRIGIARALSVRPRLIVCDEPVSSLDVSIQAQIINLLESLQERFRLTYLFIAHDLAVVRHMSTRVAVMYMGRIVELADRDAIYHGALHPYTRALLSAVPIPDPELESRRVHGWIEGEIPGPLEPPGGCTFHPRCSRAGDRCRRESPAMRPAGDGDHQVACHFFG